MARWRDNHRTKYLYFTLLLTYPFPLWLLLTRFHRRLGLKKRSLMKLVKLGLLVPEVGGELEN